MKLNLPSAALIVMCLAQTEVLAAQRKEGSDQTVIENGRALRKPSPPDPGSPSPPSPSSPTPPNCPFDIRFIFEVFRPLSAPMDTTNSCGTGMFFDANPNPTYSDGSFSYSIGPFSDVPSNYAEFDYPTYDFLAGPNQPDPPNYIFVAKLNVPGCPEVMERCLLDCGRVGPAASIDDPPFCDQTANPVGGNTPTRHPTPPPICDEYDQDKMDDYLLKGCKTTSDLGTDEDDAFCNCAFGTPYSHCKDDILDGRDLCDRTVCKHHDHDDLTPQDGDGKECFHQEGKGDNDNGDDLEETPIIEEEPSP